MNANWVITHFHRLGKLECTNFPGSKFSKYAHLKGKKKEQHINIWKHTAVLGMEKNCFLKLSHTCSSMNEKDSLLFYLWKIRKYPIVFFNYFTSWAKFNLDRSRMRPVRAERRKDRRNVTKMYCGQKLLKAKLGTVFFCFATGIW